MSFLNFVKNHINDITNYVQPSIHWREGRFARNRKSQSGDPILLQTNGFDLAKCAFQWISNCGNRNQMG